MTSDRSKVPIDFFNENCTQGCGKRNKVVGFLGFSREFKWQKVPSHFFKEILTMKDKRKQHCKLKFCITVNEV